jgi:hypothetical protein
VYDTSVFSTFDQQKVRVVMELTGLAMIPDQFRLATGAADGQVISLTPGFSPVIEVTGLLETV